MMLSARELQVAACWQARCSQGCGGLFFLNEAGLGSAPIAHAAVKTRYPIREGLVASLGPLIDMIISFATAMVVILAGLYTNTSSAQGIEITAAAFNQFVTGFGTYFVPISALVFAYSTMITWSYYGETGAFYLFGHRIKTAYRMLFSAMILVGSVVNLSVVLNFSDLLVGLIAIPNLIAILLLSKHVFFETKKYMIALKTHGFAV